MQKGEQQRAHLIDVARDLFAEKGYEGTTNHALNKAAGTSDGLLYYYFPKGKQDILDTIVKEGLTQRVDEVNIDFSDASTREELAQSIVTLIENIWSMFSREDNYQSFIISVRSRMLMSKRGSDWLVKYTDLLHERLNNALAEVVPDLGFSESQADVLTSVVVALVISPLFTDLLMGNQRQPGEDEKARLREEIRFILRIE